ncbi:lasso peptide biosynthesis B2 protein [uncultured Sphingosinicella sp.]|uniref:lasso peptide biosynthesis B2 protein n=1 Tax=uncultured Sphingosinicella sp. TaxID=478748 RepID=UPI0030DCB3DB|tara:strand:- start:13333 stop:13986 length:654 start_codon:yes stop_codon:yes gene_type:complete
MVWTLPQSISFCDVHGRLVFLDSAADLYLSLPEPAEAVFRRLMAGETIFGAASDIPPGLASAGLLVEGEGQPLAPCKSADIRASLLDQPPAPDNRHVPGLAIALARTALALRLIGLDRTLRRLSRRIPALSTLDANADAGPVAAAFERLGMLATPHEQCLVRSLALGRYLRRRGFAVDIVFGARLRPFSAHAWVQLGDTVLNDQLDTVRNFTPIRVV